MKMKKDIYLFVISCTIFLNMALPLYAEQISVDQVPLVEQLPSNTVKCVFQDKKGFMWFGTLDGLCRYDAYRLLVFRSGVNTPNLLTNNEVTCITEDNNGHLIVGTKKGIDILDQKTYQIKPFENKEVKEQEIRAIKVASDGSLWIGTKTWVYRYSPDWTSYKKYNKILPITSVNSINEDMAGNIWITFWQRGLYRYNRKNDSFVKMPKIGELDNPVQLFQDNRKKYWIGTWGEGVYLFDPNKKDQVKYEHLNVGSNQKQLSEQNYFSFVQDNKYGYVWLMSLSGICAMKYVAGKGMINVDVTNLFSNTNNIFSEFIKDKAGNLWIAAYNEGVLTVNFDKPIVHNYAISATKQLTGIATNIRAIYTDRDGDIWINQNRCGLGLYTPGTDLVRFFQVFPTLKNLHGMSAISCISEFSFNKGEIWVGAEYDSKIYCLKKNQGNVVLTRQIDLKDINPNPGDPRLFYEDSNKNVWIVTTKKLFVLPHDRNKIVYSNFMHDNMTGVTEDNTGSIWISSNEYGLFRIQIPNNFRITKPNVRRINVTTGNGISNDVESIYADKKGRIWIGCQKGDIFVYDIKKRQFKDLSTLIDTRGEGILNIISDNIGHIWFSTNKRIIEFNPHSGGAINYSANKDVLVNSFNKNSLCRDKSGKIFYGGNKGISVFTSYKKLDKRYVNIKSLITNLIINGKSVFLGDNSRFDIQSQSLQLEPDDRDIEIDFSTLDYTFSSKIQYAYKMEGVDDNWIYTRDGRQYAFYNKLPKGKYTFYVKATAENHLWGIEVTKFTIYKRPAFYETWWAYIFYMVITLSLFYYVYIRAKRRLRLRNELRIAMIEKDKTEKLVQTKLRYFTHISHDFLTPLTIINCLIDDARMTYNNDIPQLEMMRSNLNKLKRLVQQVLDFRKAESGNMMLKISQGDITSLITEVCYSNFEPLMKKKNIKFSLISTPEQIPAYFDADKIDKIIFNLLSNALKYTPERGEIKVELEQYSNLNRAYLSIKVIDTGIGIAQEEMIKIFTPFYNNINMDASESHGIGLSLTKDLVTLHHGTITVESKLNMGATFAINIPINKEDYRDIEFDAPDLVTVYEQDINLMSNYNEMSELEHKIDQEKISDNLVLIVEDNEELSGLMVQILSRYHKVISSKNGIEALDTIKNNEVDIIISDVMMPEMDGLELCRTLKTNLETSHIPVILLTAKNSTEDRIECYNAGADGYISKPFELTVLEARIDNFLANKRSKQREFRSDVTINVSTLETSSIDEKFLNGVISVIEENMSETEFDVNQLAELLSTSKSSLYRKIKAMTGLSPVEFIRNIRLKHACVMLKANSGSISEIAYALGFSNPQYFATCFKDEFKITPSEYQKSLGE